MKTPSGAGSSGPWRLREVGALLADPEVLVKPGRFATCPWSKSRLGPWPRAPEFRELETERSTAADMAQGADAEIASSPRTNCATSTRASRPRDSS